MALITEAHFAMSTSSSQPPSTGREESASRNPLTDRGLAREGGGDGGGGGERTDEQPDVLVEPHAAAQHHLGKQGQRFGLVEQVRELRDDEDEDQQHRREARHDEDRGVEERASAAPPPSRWS